MPQSTPRQLGKYKILEEIGRGGFATVYKAEDAALGPIVMGLIGFLQAQKR